MYLKILGTAFNLLNIDIDLNYQYNKGEMGVTIVNHLLIKSTVFILFSTRFTLCREPLNIVSLNT